MLADILVKGIVQGVGFRPFVYRLANANGLHGYVQNRGDAGVRIVVEGEGHQIERFIRELRARRPPLSEIHDLTVRYRESDSEFSAFEIRESFHGGNEGGSTIPPDIATCDECLSELRRPSDRRYRYFFITCTDCGPRYTITCKVPYDRYNTSMNCFQMCDECMEEYESPRDRRFHAQTNACPRCGPRLMIASSRGEPLACSDPISEAGRLLEEGHILAIKGNGGYHLSCVTTDPNPLERLRAIKERRSKPFAIMARDLETVRTFAEVGVLEAELLKSYARPIVLLKKSQGYFLSELISPGLHTVGVMLPYSGLHHLLFDAIQEPALVMTSANPPNEPIITDDRSAMKRLGKVAEYFLYHNRKIEQRCDDSVLRVIGQTRAFIRRSRGYAPAPVPLKTTSPVDILALGAELNTTCCILMGRRAYISQHIGDLETPETLKFLEEVIQHLLSLTKAKPKALACDLHPRFNTTHLTNRLSEEWGIPAVQVQHHHAHLSKLMVEHGLDEAAGIVCDGYGYGPDGTAWGGEVLYSNIEGYRRLGHLQEQPMVGGDLATRYPLRMVAGILHDHLDLEVFLRREAKHLPHGKAEAELILKQLKSDRIPFTSSCGRILDAVSSLLGLCYERTYEGEPAMKLEAAAAQGSDTLKLEVKICGDSVDTTYLLEEIYRSLGTVSIPDLAFSAQSYIARSLAELAIEKAYDLGISTVGFTGGVACNEHITNIMKSVVEDHGLKFITHNMVPPGDGGISLGQAVAAAYRVKNSNRS
ncbi:MAG: carbamoyltransferase HypF [Candidatus Bathyarchaeia archaeon]